MSPISGGDSGGVPPLPIPNREVKPACADGTAMQCGRVGNRLFSSRQRMESSGREILRRTFFRFPSCREYNRGLHGRFNFLVNNRGFISRIGVPGVSSYCTSFHFPYCCSFHFPYCCFFHFPYCSFFHLYFLLLCLSFTSFVCIKCF